MAITSDLFRQKIISFRNHLSQKQLNEFRLTYYRDVSLEIDEIQQRQTVQYRLLGTGRLQSFLEGMEHLSKVVEVFLNVSDVVAFIWGPIKFILHTASSWSHAMDSLLEAYEELGEKLPLITQYERHFGTEPRMATLLELIYLDILEFHTKALSFFNRDVWKQVFRSIWNDFKTRFQRIISSMDKHARMLESQAQLIHIQNDQKAHDMLLKMQEEQRHANELLERFEQNRLHENRRTVRDWIGASSMIDPHGDACRHWESDRETSDRETGSWLLRGETMTDWKTSEFPKNCALWMHGIPGAGKTVLASQIIEACQQVRNSTTVYFYSKYDDETTNTALTILKGCLAQLIEQNHFLLPEVTEKCIASHESNLTDMKVVRGLLTLACRDGLRKYIILDGLDECTREERKEVLAFLAGVVRSTELREPGKVRVLVVSQMEPDIGKGLGSCGTLEILPEHNKRDIAAYVRRRAMGIQESFKLADEQRQYIESKITGAACGQFLYASLVMENLSKQANITDLTEEIDGSSFPTKLTEAYDRILKRIHKYASDSEWRYSRQILTWMVSAARPMKWYEIQGALSVDISRGTIVFENRLKSHIQDICGSLIKVYETGRVSLVHSTATTFIVNSGIVHPDCGKCGMATLCLQYLTFQCFTNANSDADIAMYIKSGAYAFQDYAIAKWQHHFSAALAAIPRLHGYDEDNAKERALQLLSEAVGDFVATHERDLIGHQTSPNEIESQLSTLTSTPTSTIAASASEVLRDFESEEQFAIVHSHIESHIYHNANHRNEISLADLASCHRRVRTMIETTWTSDQALYAYDATFKDMYGMHRFKCSKLACYNFHHGFEDAKTRDSHLNRHDRPFLCPVIDCSIQDFGFQAKSHLDSHIRNYHPELEDKANSFPSLALPVGEKFRFHCQVANCGKKFTRNAAAKDHALTHTGQKPNKCSHCGKGFARKNDQHRHERTIHIQRMH